MRELDAVFQVEKSASRAVSLDEMEQQGMLVRLRNGVARLFLSLSLERENCRG